MRRTLKSWHRASDACWSPLFQAEDWEGDSSDLGNLSGTRGSWEDAISCDTKGLGITDGSREKREMSRTEVIFS